MANTTADLGAPRRVTVLVPVMNPRLYSMTADDLTTALKGHFDGAGGLETETKLALTHELVGAGRPAPVRIPPESQGNANSLVPRPLWVG